MRLRSRQCPVWRVHVGLLCQLCGLLLTRESPSVEETASPPETCAPTAPVSGAVGSWLFACGAGVDLLFPFRVNLGGVGGTPRELPSLSPGDLRGRRVLLWQREVLSGPPQLSPTPNHRGC